MKESVTRKRRYFIYYPRHMLTRCGVGLSHGTPTGGAVLRTEVSWRNINGIWINWPTGCLFLLFRRPSW